jgi:hypothetical protein
MHNNGMGGREGRKRRKDVKSKNREVSNYAFFYFLPSLVLSDVNSLLSTLLSIVVTHFCLNPRHANRNMNKYLTVETRKEYLRNLSLRKQKTVFNSN